MARTATYIMGDVGIIAGEPLHICPACQTTQTIEWGPPVADGLRSATLGCRHRVLIDARGWPRNGQRVKSFLVTAARRELKRKENIDGN